jgi:hypothetical protein
VGLAYRMYVKRGNPEQYELLYNTFSERVAVVWERRRGDRRKLAEPAGEERRRAERRGPLPPSWQALGFVVTRIGRDL